MMTSTVRLDGQLCKYYAYQQIVTSSILFRILNRIRTLNRQLDLKLNIYKQNNEYKSRLKQENNARANKFYTFMNQISIWWLFILFCCCWLYDDIYRSIQTRWGSMSTRSTSIFKDPNVAKHLSLLHDKYVIGNLHILRRHLWKRKFWTIIGMFYVPLEFLPKMKNWIYHYSTGFLNYTSVFSNSAILLGLPNAPRNLFPNY